MKQNFPDAKVYQDWREMLKKEKGNLDIACVGTPDHMHAPIAMSAMRQGLHVYVQKPLAHDIYEVRKLTEMARSKKLVSQMGIQVHSSREYQTAVQLIQSEAIGKIKEVHSWSNKTWGDLSPMPDRSDPVPATLRLGWLARRDGEAAVHRRRILSPGELAQADRLRHGDVRRHGLPHLRPGLRRAAADGADFGAVGRPRADAA